MLFTNWSNPSPLGEVFVDVIVAQEWVFHEQTLLPNSNKKLAKQQAILAGLPHGGCTAHIYHHIQYLT